MVTAYSDLGMARGAAIALAITVIVPAVARCRAEFEVTYRGTVPMVQPR